MGRAPDKGSDWSLLGVGFEDGDGLAGAARFERVGGDDEGDAGAELFVKRSAEVLRDADAGAVFGREHARSLPLLAGKRKLHPVVAFGVDLSEAVGDGLSDRASDFDWR